MKTGIAPALVFLANVLTATAGLAQSSPSPEGAPTDVRLFLPFDVGGGLGATVVAVGRVSGECFTGSLASPGRPDAWRCSAGNSILDPCYQGLPRAAFRAKDPSPVVS